MLAEERQKRIVEILGSKEFATVDELAGQLEVSSMTIRRDLDKCVKNGLVSRHFGGASLKESFRNETAFDEKAKQNIDEKTSISQYASGLVKNNDTIFLGAGTTVQRMIESLKAISGLTIITDDLNIALEISKTLSANLIMLGGTVINELGCTVGYFSEEQIRKLHVDIAFLGGLAIDRNFDLYSQHESKIALRQLIVANSNSSYLLVDSSKFMKTSLFKLNGLEDYSGVITNRTVSEEERQFAVKKGIHFIFV